MAGAQNLKGYTQGESGVEENIFGGKSICHWDNKISMYVCPCIIYETDERNPLDATIYYYK